MNCDIIREQLASYLYGELDTEAREAVDRHLASCPRCAEEARSLRLTIAALDRWDAPPAANAATARLPFRSRAAADGSARRRSFLKAGAVGALAAVVTFLLLVYTQASIERRDGQLVIAFSDTPGASAIVEPTVGSSAFLLLLKQGTALGSAHDVATESALVNEYSQWAAGVRDQGREVTGQKLTEPRRWLENDAAGADVIQRDTTGADVMGGFFRISADSFEDALAVARTCPHLKYGGRIEVREVDSRTRH